MKTLAALFALALLMPAALIAADDAPVALDLSAASKDFALTVKAPKGATAKDDFGDVAVNAGDGFQLVIHSAQCDIAASKKEITANTLNKLKRFIVETDDTLVYESAVFGASEFHFLTNVKVGDKTYAAEDNKGPRYTQAQVEAMVASAKSLAAK